VLDLLALAPMVEVVAGADLRARWAGIERQIARLQTEPGTCSTG